jgi:hypothetical protein
MRFVPVLLGTQSWAPIARSVACDKPLPLEALLSSVVYTTLRCTFDWRSRLYRLGIYSGYGRFPSNSPPQRILLSVFAARPGMNMYRDNYAESGRMGARGLNTTNPCWRNHERARPTVVKPEPIASGDL